MTRAEISGMFLGGDTLGGGENPRGINRYVQQFASDSRPNRHAAGGLPDSAILPGTNQLQCERCRFQVESELDGLGFGQQLGDER